MGKYVDPTRAPFVDAEVEHVAKITDGDTIYVSRNFATVITDDVIITTTDRQPVKLRLVIVNTPERGKTGWSQATKDTTTWLLLNAMHLRVRTYGRDDFGRLLADVYNADTHESLSSWLVKPIAQGGAGWAPYVP